MCMSQGFGFLCQQYTRRANFLENWLCQIGWHAIRLPRSPHERKQALKTTQGLDKLDMVHVVNYDRQHGTPHFTAKDISLVKPLMSYWQNKPRSPKLIVAGVATQQTRGKGAVARPRQQQSAHKATSSINLKRKKDKLQENIGQSP